MLTSLLKTITKGKDLSERESAIVMEQIMEGTISDVQLAAFLTALTTKGASEREITAFARTMRKYSMRVPCTMDVFDIVGTGGGRTKTFNISTTASFVIAAGASASPSTATGPRRRAVVLPTSWKLRGQYLSQPRKLPFYVERSGSLLLLYAVLLLYDEAY